MPVDIATPALKSIRARITAIVLAGGEGSRVGHRDKGLLQWHNGALIDHVITRVQPQVDNIIISANRHIERYRQRGFRVISDSLPGFAGPLAGIAACVAAIGGDSEFVLTVPCDMPQLPSDLVSRLFPTIEQENMDCAVAHDGTYAQYLVALYRNTALHALPEALREDVRAVRHWQQRINSVAVDFSDQAACFGNINTPEQLS